MAVTLSGSLKQICAARPQGLGVSGAGGSVYLSRHPSGHSRRSHPEIAGRSGGRALRQSASCEHAAARSCTGLNPVGTAAKLPRPRGWPTAPRAFRSGQAPRLEQRRQRRGHLVPDAAETGTPPAWGWHRSRPGPSGSQEPRGSPRLPPPYPQKAAATPQGRGAPRAPGHSGRRGRVQEQEVPEGERRVGSRKRDPPHSRRGREGREEEGQAGPGRRWVQSREPTGAPRGGVDPGPRASLGAVYLALLHRPPGRGGGREGGGEGAQCAGTGCRCGAPGPAGAPRGPRAEPASGRRGRRAAGAG